MMPMMTKDNSQGAPVRTLEPIMEEIGKQLMELPHWRQVEILTSHGGLVASLDAAKAVLALEAQGIIC